MMLLAFLLLLPWNLATLFEKPQIYEAKTEEPGVKALYYESVPFRGKATRVFAYYGGRSSRLRIRF